MSDKIGVFAVSKYQDTYTHKRARETPFMGTERCVYFDTEDDARQFLVDRANAEMAKAEKALDLAMKRYRKCVKKFPPLTEPAAVCEEEA